MCATIVLADPEVAILQELLEAAVDHLLLEIAHAHHRSMRQGLQAREAVVRTILEKLGAPSGGRAVLNGVSGSN